MIIRSGIPKPSAFVHTSDVGFPAQATNENLVFWSRDSNLATLLTAWVKKGALRVLQLTDLLGYYPALTRVSLSMKTLISPTFFSP